MRLCVKCYNVATNWHLLTGPETNTKWTSSRVSGMGLHRWNQFICPLQTCFFFKLVKMWTMQAHISGFLSLVHRHFYHVRLESFCSLSWCFPFICPVIILSCALTMTSYPKYVSTLSFGMKSVWPAWSFWNQNIDFIKIILKVWYESC